MPDEPQVAPLKIFLSHAHADSDVAAALHQSVADTFNGLIKFFRSSDDEESIRIGDSIKETIKHSLGESAAAISLLSHSSINRPWMNIEFGALWMLDAKIIPVCLPDLKLRDLPLQFADTKVCSLGSPDECTALLRQLQNLVSERYTFNLPSAKIKRHGNSLSRKVDRAIQSRATVSYDEPPLPQRKTVWVLGSYSKLSPDQKNIAQKLVEILAQGLVNKGIRLISGESDMLRDLAQFYRSAGIASPTPVPAAVMLYCKLRQRDPHKLFHDAIGVMPDLAIVIGGRADRGRVEEECDLAHKGGIPLISVPAAGGAAANIPSTADRASNLYGLLNGTDIGDVSSALLQAIERYV